MSEKNWLTTNSDEVKKVIEENPNLPLAFEMVGDYSDKTSITLATARVGMVLTTEGPNPDIVYTDFAQFVEDLECIADKENLDASWVERQVRGYDKYWEKAIIVRVGE